MGARRPGLYPGLPGGQEGVGGGEVRCSSLGTSFGEGV